LVSALLKSRYSQLQEATRLLLHGADLKPVVNLVVLHLHVQQMHTSSAELRRLVWGRATAQAVSRRLLTTEDGFAPRAVHVGFVVDKVALGQVFLPVLLLYAASIIPPLLHIDSCIIWGMNNGPVSSPVPQKHSINPSLQ
jgi:hypothetical protein